jgi:hypothetical protein
MLHERKGLPKERFKDIWDNKQKYTLEALSKLATINPTLGLYVFFS